MGVRGAVEWVTAAAVGVALLVGGGEADAQQAPGRSVPPGQAAAMVAVSPGVTFGAHPACPYAARAGRCAGMRDALRWGATGTSIALLGAAVSFHAVWVLRGVEFEAALNNHALITSADVTALAAQRQTLESLAIGFYVGGGLLAAGSALMWLLPHAGHCGRGGCPRRAAPPIAFDAGPGSARISVSF